MKVALIGAELEENLGLRYMASTLELRGHSAEIIAFNTEHDIGATVERVLELDAGIAGLSMVFTSRAREFCRLAESLRDRDYGGHIIAGGHFAALNARRLLADHPSFDSVALGEGEHIISDLADLRDAAKVDGLCFRAADGEIKRNPSQGNPADLDALPFPKRDKFHNYFGKPIASILSSRGCWRNCDFCSITAWYKSGGGKRFRIRSIANIVAEMKELYTRHNVRIFNFQDDNFYLPADRKALQRFQELQAGLRKAGITDIAIAVKARPDSITYESTKILDELGLFRVFLGVENASEHGLRNLNRQCELSSILNALEILNEFGVHIAFNLLMFEPDTTMDDILINLRFVERHIENPFNFCRAEAYAGTGLEAKLLARKALQGDYFGFDYQIADPHVESFHHVANHAFFERNFSDFGLHYFNMQVDFYYQLLRRFFPKLLTESLRSEVRSFIKKTNLDTHECLAMIYDFITAADIENRLATQQFARKMRQCVDARSQNLLWIGRDLLTRLENAYEDRRKKQPHAASAMRVPPSSPFWRASDNAADRLGGDWWRGLDVFGAVERPIPYSEFAKRIEREQS